MIYVKALATSSFEWPRTDGNSPTADVFPRGQPTLNETTNGGKRWKLSAGHEQAGRREELKERIVLTEHRRSDELAAHEAQHVAVS